MAGGTDAGAVLLAIASDQASQITDAQQGSSWSDVNGASGNSGNSGTYGMLGTVLLGAGSVAATVGVIWLLPGDEENESVEVSVSAQVMVRSICEPSFDTTVTTLLETRRE